LRAERQDADFADDAEYLKQQDADFADDAERSFPILTSRVQSRNPDGSF